MIGFPLNWFLSLSLPWKVGSLLIITLILFFAGAVTGWRISSKFCEADKVEQLEADIRARDKQLETLEFRIKAQDAIIQSNTEKRIEKDQKIFDLQQELEKSYESLPSNNCFDANRLSILDRAREASNKQSSN